MLQKELSGKLDNKMLSSHGYCTQTDEKPAGTELCQILESMDEAGTYLHPKSAMFTILLSCR